MVTRAAFDQSNVDPQNDPEWTAIRLIDGVDAESVIARHPQGVPDPLQIPTIWFTDARPAELIQLGSVMSLLAGAVGVSLMLVIFVDDAATPALAVGGLIAGSILATGVGFLAARAVARNVRPGFLLHQQ